MSKLIALDRKLCVVNNHFVTDADGAPCVCGDDQTEPDAPCDGERPCAFNLRISGVSIPPELPASGNATVRVIQFSGLNSVQRLNRDTAVPSAKFPILLSVEWSAMLGGIKRTVTFTWTEGFISFDGVVGCDTESGNLGLNGRIVAGARCSPQSVVDESGGFGWSFGNYGCLTPGLLAGEGETSTVGQEIPDFRIPPTGPWTSATPGSLFLPFSGSATLVGWIFDCEGTVPTRSVYLARSCDNSSVIAVDLATNINGKISPKVGGVVYKMVDEQTDIPPTTVEWVNETCPDSDPPVGVVLWQRCTNPAELVRTSNDLGTATNMTWTQTTTNVPHPDNPAMRCVAAATRAYKRVTDDGGDHPTVIGVAHPGPCAAMVEETHYSSCIGEFDGDGTRANDLAISAPPPPFNPMAAQIAAFGCSGCGDPGI